MKISIVSYSDSVGGAARAAYRIHRSLKETDTFSEMLVLSKNTDDISVTTPSKIHCVVSRGLGFLSKFLQKLQVSNNPILHSFNIFGSKLLYFINKSDADIVNIHWVNNEALSIRQISKIKKPIVMTLHDMWAFCGAEHLSIDSDMSNFRLGYDKESPDSDYISGFNLNKWVWKRKKKYWNTPFVIVTPSSWLGRCARESLLFQDWEIQVIPNAVDTDLYKPIDKSFCRSIFNLPKDKKIIGFGAVGGSADPNKGFDLLKKALERLCHREDIHCVVFGQSRQNMDSDYGGISVDFVGHLHDDFSLACLYNCFDLMVVPSRQENLPQTATESLSCGVPVVAFNTSGLVDAVVHKNTGYLANAYDPIDLAFGINWCLRPECQHVLSKNARRRAVDLWSKDIVAEQYNRLFENMLNE